MYANLHQHTQNCDLKMHSTALTEYKRVFLVSFDVVYNTSLFVFVFSVQVQQRENKLRLHFTKCFKRNEKYGLCTYVHVMYIHIYTRLKLRVKLLNLYTYSYNNAERTVLRCLHFAFCFEFQVENVYTFIILIEDFMGDIITYCVVNTC